MAAQDPSSQRGPIPERSGAFGAGLSLLADQAQARRGAARGGEIPALGGDTILSDSSVPGGNGGFQAPTYMARPEAVAPPIAGELDETGGGFVGSTAEEAARARQLQEQQLAAARQFIGAGAEAPGAEAAAGAAGGPEEEEEETETEEREEEPEEEYDPAEIIRLQAIERQAISAAEEEEEEEERGQVLKRQVRQNANRTVRMFFTDVIGAGGAAETFGLSFIVALIAMNLQMFGTYFFKFLKGPAGLESTGASTCSEMLFDQSFFETACTIGGDTCCCFSLPLMPPCYIATAIILLMVLLQKALSYVGISPQS